MSAWTPHRVVGPVLLGPLGPLCLTTIRTAGATDPGPGVESWRSACGCTCWQTSHRATPAYPARAHQDATGVHVTRRERWVRSAERQEVRIQPAACDWVTCATARSARVCTPPRPRCPMATAEPPSWCYLVAIRYAATCCPRGFLIVVSQWAVLIPMENSFALPYRCSTGPIDRRECRTTPPIPIQYAAWFCDLQAGSWF
jgi:hypothetical protein